MEPSQRALLPFLLASRILSAFDARTFAPLVDTDAWPALIAAVERLPILTQTLCFESRLAATDRRVDLACSLFPFHAKAAQEALADLANTEVGWRRLCDFLDVWAGTSAPLHLKVPFLCVALDLPEKGEPPAPCLSLCSDPDFFGKRLGLVPLNSRAAGDELATLVEGCYAILNGNPLPTTSKDRVRRWLASSEALELKHFSVMLARADSPLKLNFRVELSRIGEALRALEWHDQAPSLVREIYRFADWSGYAQLNVVVHPQLSGPLEVEVFPASPELAPADRERFLDRLVAAGLSSAEKAGVLRSTWRQPLCGTIDGRSLGAASYIKLRFLRGEALDAKAYLGIMPRFLTHSQSLATPGY